MNTLKLRQVAAEIVERSTERGIVGHCTNKQALDEIVGMVLATIGASGDTNGGPHESAARLIDGPSSRSRPAGSVDADADRVRGNRPGGQSRSFGSILPVDPTTPPGARRARVQAGGDGVAAQTP